MWDCICDCGCVGCIDSVSLTHGRSKSCGCFKIDSATKHGKSRTSEYASWKNMVRRCNNINDEAYCERWMSFENFLKDMGKRPDGLSIDRKDNDGSYEPGNCRWVTRTDQMRNRRVRRDNLTGITGVS